MSIDQEYKEAMRKMARVYEITATDPTLPTYGKTERLTEEQARKRFGRQEWNEVKANCFPHITVCEVTDG